MDIGDRPIIYYYGDDSAKNHIKEIRSSGLAAQPIQWSRRSDQPSQSVHVDPNFLPLQLPVDGHNGFSTQSTFPVIYIFFCPNDHQYYSDCGRKAFGHWLAFLSSHKLKEWLFITITDKSKKISSRNSVVSKLKRDFAIEFTDHLHDLPSDYDSYPGILQALNVKLRNAVISVFNKNLNALENKAQKLVETRQSKDFDAMEYILCLEETAALYNCMSLYDKALECMKMADDNLTIALASVTESGVSGWSRRLLSNSCDNLVSDSTIISTYAAPELVQRVRRREANLFELRIHILTCECALLQALDRIAELPALAVRTIRLCTKEAGDLKITVPEFQLCFWTLLTTLQTLNIFRLGTPCVPKAEDFIHLRREFLQAHNLLQHSFTPAPANIDEDSNCPSNSSELSSSTLVSARFKAMESLDLLEDVSLQSEGTFNILARAVLSSVVADNHARSGRVTIQTQELVGTSRWTVDLWRLACVALARLGRYAGLWPDPTRRFQDPRSNPMQSDKLISVMRMLNNFINQNADTLEADRFSFSGSFGIQLSIAFVSPKSFEEVYRKFVGACIFFQSSSGSKRDSICTSLELANFYRDAKKFMAAESLYHQATKIFLKESWTALATYSLLQQLLCQQIQWRSENVETTESSIFRRYVQTALILAVTPTQSLHHCYDLLKRRGSYFDSLFEEGAIAGCTKTTTPVTAMADFSHVLETVAEHHARVALPPVATEAQQQRSPFPLSVRSLRPFFRLISVDLEDANPHTHRQVIRLHLHLIGARPMLVRVSIGARPTASEDWNVPPLSSEAGRRKETELRKLFNVDLSSEGVRVGIIGHPSDAVSTTSADFSNGGSSDHPAPPSFFYNNASMTSSSANFINIKESVVQRLFSRASARGRSSGSLFKKSGANTPTTTNQPVKRPTSIDFLNYRDRMNTLDSVNPLPSDSILDGISITSDYSHPIYSSAATPERTSMSRASSSSDRRGVRRHKKGFSLSDLSSFMQSLKIQKNESSSRNGATDTGFESIVTTKAVVIENNDIFFYPRCHSTNLFHCRLSNSTQNPIENDGDALTFQPGDNYLLMETSHYGFHLPGEISISLYNNTENVEQSSPGFVFSSSITPEQFGSTWSDETILGRLLPRIEQIEALRLSKAYSIPEQLNKAVVINGMTQPVFLTVRVGTLTIERRDNNNDLGLRLLRFHRTEATQQIIWGQHYAVSFTEESKVEKTPISTDLGDLVLAPDEKLPSSPLLFTPGTRLCLRCSFLLRPLPNEQISIVLPSGRPNPIDLQAIGVLIFKAKVSSFHKKYFLIQVQVSVRDTTWPVLGSIDNLPQLNPFYCQGRIAFKFSTVGLVFRSFKDTPSQPSPLVVAQSPRGPSAPAPQRSISVVEFAPSSPAIAANRQPQSPNSREVGNSMFFPLKISEGAIDQKVSNHSGLQDPIQLIEPLDSEEVVRCGRPLTVSWTVQSSYFNSLLRPMPKSNKVGVSAEFTFLVGTCFDDVRPQMRYSCNFVKTI